MKTSVRRPTYVGRSSVPSSEKCRGRACAQPVLSSSLSEIFSYPAPNLGQKHRGRVSVKAINDDGITRPHRTVHGQAAILAAHFQVLRNVVSKEGELAMFTDELQNSRLIVLVLSVRATDKIVSSVNDSAALIEATKYKCQIIESASHKQKASCNEVKSIRNTFIIYRKFRCKQDFRCQINYPAR